jgi:hypothetical protein
MSLDPRHDLLDRVLDESAVVHNAANELGLGGCVRQIPVDIGWARPDPDW